MRHWTFALRTTVLAMGLGFLLGWKQASGDPKLRPPLPAPVDSLQHATPRDSAVGAHSSRKEAGNRQALSTTADDHAIVATIVAIDSAEVAAVTFAQSKNLSARVLEYVRALERDHRANLAKGRVVSRDVHLASRTRSSVASLQGKRAADLAELKDLEGRAFETAFLVQRIQADSDALNRIDSMLEPVKDLAIRQYAVESRTQIASHLERAKALRPRPQP
jgi:predicted outer membrane protein